MNLTPEQLARMAPNVEPTAIRQMMEAGVTVGLGRVDDTHSGVTRFNPPRAPGAPNYGRQAPTTPGNVTVDPIRPEGLRSENELAGIVTHELQHVRDRNLKVSNVEMERRAHLAGGTYPELGEGDYRVLSRMPLAIRKEFQGFLRMYYENQSGRKTGRPQMTR